jgi:hypothetical protein
MEPRSAHGDTLGQQAFASPGFLQKHQAMGVNPDRAAQRRRLGLAVDDARHDPAPGQLHRGRQPGRSGPGDQRAAFRHSHSILIPL